MIKYQRKRSSRVFKDKYPSDAQSGDLIINSLLGRLYRANKWKYRGKQEVAYRLIKPPDPNLTVKLIAGEIYWVSRTVCECCGRAIR